MIKHLDLFITFTEGSRPCERYQGLTPFPQPLINRDSISPRKVLIRLRTLNGNFGQCFWAISASRSWRLEPTNILTASIRIFVGLPPYTPYTSISISSVVSTIDIEIDSSATAIF